MSLLNFYKIFSSNKYCIMYYYSLVNCFRCLSHWFGLIFKVLTSDHLLLALIKQLLIINLNIIAIYTILIFIVGLPYISLIFLRFLEKRFFRDYILMILYGYTQYLYTFILCIKTILFTGHRLQSIQPLSIQCTAKHFRLLYDNIFCNI